MLKPTLDIAPFSLLYSTLSLPDGSLSLTFLPDGSLSLRFWLNNCAVFVPFTRPFGSKTLTSYSTPPGLLSRACVYASDVHDYAPRRRQPGPVGSQRQAASGRALVTPSTSPQLPTTARPAAPPSSLAQRDRERASRENCVFSVLGRWHALAPYPGTQWPLPGQAPRHTLAPFTAPPRRAPPANTAPSPTCPAFDRRRRTSRSAPAWHLGAGVAGDALRRGVH